MKKYILATVLAASAILPSTAIASPRLDQPSDYVLPGLYTVAPAINWFINQWLSVAY